MKKTGFFFFLLVSLTLCGCQKNVDVNSVDADSVKYHKETVEYTSDEEVPSPEETITLDGKKYKLVSWNDEVVETINGYDTKTREEKFENVLSDKIVIPETKKIDGQEYYLDDVKKTSSEKRNVKLPKTMTYIDEQPDEVFTEAYWDEKSESYVDITYHLVDSNTTESWVDDLIVSLTTYDYDTYNYVLNGALVTATDDVINISGAEEQILAYANMNSSEYRLYGAYWDGGVYQNGDTLSRNAIAYGSRLQRTVEAYYEAAAELPSLDNVIVTYITKVANPDKDINTICRTFLYEQDRTTEITVITIGVVIGIIFVLLLLFKLKKGNEKEDKNV